MFHLVYENKSLEKKTWDDTNHSNYDTKWAVSHATCKTLMGKWKKLPDERGIMPYGKYMAIYSAFLKDDGTIIFHDSRHVPNSCFEDLHYTYFDGKKQVTSKEPMITRESFNLDSVGTGSDYFKIGDKYVMDCAGLKGSTWFKHIIASDRLDGGWKQIGKKLKNQKNKLVFPCMFYSDGWKALTTTSDSKDYYLSEIITDGYVYVPPKPEEPKPKEPKKWLSKKWLWLKKKFTWIK